MAWNIFIIYHNWHPMMGILHKPNWKLYKFMVQFLKFFNFSVHIVVWRLCRLNTGLQRLNQNSNSKYKALQRLTLCISFKMIFCESFMHWLIWHGMTIPVLKANLDKYFHIAEPWFTFNFCEEIVFLCHFHFQNEDYLALNGVEKIYIVWHFLLHTLFQDFDRNTNKVIWNFIYYWE